MMRCGFRFGCIGLLASAILAASSVAVRAHEYAAQQRPTLRSDASHEVSVMPDIAVIRFTVFKENENQATAKKDADALLKQVQAIVADHDIDSKKLSTGHAAINPRYRYRKNSDRVLEGYTVSYSMTLEVEALSRVGSILQALSDAGVDRVHNVSYQLDDPHSAQLSALEQAIKKASAKAGVMAKAAGATLGPIISISQQEQHMSPAPVMMRAEAFSTHAAADSAPAAPAVGEIDIKADVIIVYELQNN